ncbi:hypothetical protein V7U47_10795 [Segatella copri]|uniref:hypothetical protein n=1 Tax=Segatella copri TaxID=165179 RepID=UPI002FF2896E
MNKIKRYLYKAMFWLLPWLCAVPLASCSFDDDIVESREGPATMQLSITAREEGDLNTRAGSVEIGQDHEYMHNLLVLFIQNGKVVKKFLPDLRYNEAAQEGNLRDWTSDQFMLDLGTYTVYAFANIDTYYSEHWGSLTGLEEGASVESLDIDKIVLDDDPASKLDFETYFIPMSAKEEITVVSDTQNISIGLDRLVSKIRMSITGNAGTRVTALSFGGYADKIGLFSDTPVSDILYDREYSVVENGESPVQLNSDDTYQFADFYVNSSPANSGYKVTLNTDEKNGTTYTATTTRKVLPRNSIFPLVLNLTGYEVSLDLHCWVSPIGNVPVEVELSPDSDYYTCTIPEGCQFEFTVGVTPVSSSGTPAVTNLKSAWTFDETKITGLVFDNYTEGDTTVKGHVTASAGETFNLTFDVTWTPEGGNPTTRRYNVEITTGNIADFPFKPSQINTRASEFTLDYLGPEMLNMFIK